MNFLSLALCVATSSTHMDSTYSMGHWVAEEESTEGMENDESFPTWLLWS